MKKSEEQVDLERDKDQFRIVPARERAIAIELLRTKYDSYVAQKHGVFCATLSTFVKSRSFAIRHFPSFWERYFIDRIRRKLPHKLRGGIDHDYFVEMTKDGHLHFHGFLAVKGGACRKIWRDGKLAPTVENSLESLSRIGGERLFKVNSFLVEPLRDGAEGVARWSQYSSKDLLHISSLEYLSEALALNRERHSESQKAKRSKGSI